ncbi:MAG: FAD-binding oxidoreductase [Desulfobacterales bacterium]|nr:FAD-binding oxidoreductase [Desulfobacterales bacterium]
MKLGKRSNKSTARRQVDVLVVGGGVTGAGVGYGLARKGVKVCVIDDTPSVDRASRSNMGLIWVQSKALGVPEYMRWGFNSSRLFPELVRELEDASGIHIPYNPTGGLIPTVGEAEYASRSNYIEGLKKEAGSFGYNGSMISRSELEKLLPKIRFGEEVCGAAWCEEDGFLEPLKMMFAMRKGMVNHGGQFIPECRALSVAREGAGYVVKTSAGEIACEKLVLAGGLSNRQLGSWFDVRVPVTPDRAQDLLTERVNEKVLPIPVLGLCQTPGGTIMVGYKHEYVGTDTGFTPEAVASEGRWATSVWPDLAKLRVIRCWSCLRVMPKDGLPIYDTVPGHKNVFVFNCHSAVTLAGIHSATLPDYVLTGALPEDGRIFKLSRFDKTEGHEEEDE